ncbi:Fungal specific transcription factor domain-containing protein [Cladophialophora immunda]|nr:Fungal specific transcription factor domain-containing protein [Cladophialophora immunda]
MIQSLRQRLQELEKAAAMPPPSQEMQTSTAAPGQPPDQPVQAEDTSNQNSSEPLNNAGGAGDREAYNGHHLSQDTATTDCAPANDVSASNAEGEASPFANDSATSNLSSSKDNCHSSRCIGLYNFERLMKPIGIALDRGTNTSEGTIAARPADRGLSPTPEPNSPLPERVKCNCDRLLEAMPWNLPLRRQADFLVAIYFARHARMFPVLHRPTFMKQYEALWEARADSEKVGHKCVSLCRQRSKGKLFPATVNVVFALAALFSSGHHERNAAYGAEFFQLAETVDVHVLLNEESGLEFVQLGLLMAFYLQSTERFSKCWNMAGLALRMAQNMGLHFSLPEARRRGLLCSYPTQVECEMRTRVWHACILLETEVSMTFAQPLTIPTHGKRIGLPEAIDDSRLSDEVGKWNMQPRDLPSLMEYYVSTLQLHEILGQVLNRQDTKSDKPSDTVATVRAVLTLDSEITEWRDRLPLYLRHDSSRELDPVRGAAGSEPIPDAEVVLGFPDLARRLHCRFLCVRQLVLRPALDLLFEKQQTEKSLITADRTAKAKLKDSVISDIAAQCVLLAVELVEFLTTQIQTDSFICWWYNIHYLHTSGSTILLGRLCTFHDGAVLPASLSSSWELCLQYLTRYENLSSVAQRSSQLLRESAKRISQLGIPFFSDENHQSGATDERFGQPWKTSEQSDNVTAGFLNDMTQPSTAGELFDKLLAGDNSFQLSSDFLNPFGANDLEGQLSFYEGYDVRNNAPFACPSWAFFPPNCSPLGKIPQQPDGWNFM